MIVTVMLMCSAVSLARDIVTTSAVSAIFLSESSKLRTVLFLALSATCFVSLFANQISRKPLNDLRHIHTEDVFGPSLGRV